MATRFGTENEDRVREGFDQDTAAQVKGLRKAGCKKIFEANVLRTRVFCRGCMAGTAIDRPHGGQPGEFSVPMVRGNNIPMINGNKSGDSRG